MYKFGVSRFDVGKLDVGDMSSVETLDGGELLIAERFTEEEAEVKCLEMSKKLGLPFFDFALR